MIRFLFILILSLLIFNDPVKAMAGESVAYSRLSNHYWQIWVIDPQTFQAKQVTFSDGDKRDPTWIQNGQALAFRTNNGQLFTVDINGKNEKQVLKKYQQINNPHYSNQNGRVVFIRFHPQKQDLSEIYTSDITGDNPLLLSDDTKLKYQPRFSADGTKIAFVKADEKNKHHQIWMMNSDGTDKTQLTSQPGFNTLPHFSPDGDAMTFTSNSTGDYEIYQINFTTKQVKNLTKHPGLDTHSVYSPDGRQIAFVSNRSGRRQIWVMDANGSGPQMLTDSEYEAIEPAWSGF